jgi:hypothetical protein
MLAELIRPNAAIAALRHLPTRADLQRLQSTMLPIASEMPTPQHIFHPGWYERRLLVPTGMLIVGKIHRHDHILGVISGHALVISEFGRDEVRGGYLGLSQAGVKRAVLAFEDTFFVTIHANPDDERDLAVIEAQHIEPELLQFDNAAREVLQ